jgi:hypothetical protein
MNLALYPARVRSNDLLDGICVSLAKIVVSGRGNTLSQSRALTPLRFSVRPYPERIYTLEAFPYRILKSAKRPFETKESVQVAMRP